MDPELLEINHVCSPQTISAQYSVACILRFGVVVTGRIFSIEWSVRRSSRGETPLVPEPVTCQVLAVIASGVPAVVPFKHLRYVKSHNNLKCHYPPSPCLRAILITKMRCLRKLGSLRRIFFTWFKKHFPCQWTLAFGFCVWVSSLTYKTIHFSIKMVHKTPVCCFSYQHCWHFWITEYKLTNAFERFVY